MKSNSAYLLVTCLCSLILRYGFCFATPNGVSSTLQRNLERTTANPSNNQLYMIANNIPTSGRILLKNERNGLLNRLSFSWVDKIMKIGNKKSLDIQDLWELEANDLMSNASERFHKRLYNETLIRDNNKPLKSLRLSPESRQNVTAGEIVNYMQLDTSRMEAVANTIHIAWDGLLQVTGFTILLLRFLGPAVLAGIGAMIVMIPLQAMFLKK
eukprot:gene7377-15065_t